jgi:hypothetical protein
VVGGRAIADAIDEATLNKFGLGSLAHINDPVHVELLKNTGYQAPREGQRNPAYQGQRPYHPSKYEGIGPRYTEDGYAIRHSHGYVANSELDFPDVLPLDTSQVEDLRTRRLADESMMREEMYSQLPDDDAALMRRANLWASLAQLPGASPESQALARLAQSAASFDDRKRLQRIPNQFSTKEIERRSLGY